MKTLRKRFIYDNSAWMEVPWTDALQVFIKKWNAHSRHEKYLYQDGRLYVCDRIFHKVEMWRGGKYWYDNEQQELRDCFQHPAAEWQVARLVKESIQTAEKLKEIRKAIFPAQYTHILNEKPVCHRGAIFGENANTFTFEIDDWMANSGDTDPELMELLGFEREEVHSHHLEVYYKKDIIKTDPRFEKTWLFLVEHNNWLLRVIEEQESRYLVVASGRARRAGIVDHVLNCTGGAKWISKDECRVVER